MNVLNFFFQKFIEHGSKEFYIENAIIVVEEEHFEENYSKYKRAGFTGGCTSIDAASIISEKSVVDLAAISFKP